MDHSDENPIHLAMCFSRASGVIRGDGRGISLSLLPSIFAIFNTGIVMLYAVSHAGLLVISRISKSTSCRTDAGMNAARSMILLSFSLSLSQRGQLSLLYRRSLKCDCCWSNWEAVDETAIERPSRRVPFLFVVVWKMDVFRGRFLLCGI